MDATNTLSSQYYVFMFSRLQKLLVTPPGGDTGCAMCPGCRGYAARSHSVYIYDTLSWVSLVGVAFCRDVMWCECATMAHVAVISNVSVIMQ